MSISTYSELQTALTNYSHRDDVATRAPEFIKMAEERILIDLRCREMESVGDLATVAGTATVALPSDWFETRSMYLDTDPKQPLEPVSLSYLHSVYAGSETGKPVMAAVQGDNLVLAPTPDSAYTVKLNYYGFTSLSDANPTNWLLTKHSKLYLAAALHELFMYTRNTEEATKHDNVASALISLINDADIDARYSGSPLVIRTA